MKAGKFDERFGGSAHLEETDVCLRVRKAGYRLVFDPEATLVHLKDNKGVPRGELPTMVLLVRTQRHALFLEKLSTTGYSPYLLHHSSYA